jgi:hypothetical protein
MPTGKLSGEGKKLWEEIYQKAKKGSCKDSNDVEACAAASAWAALKRAGWKEDKDGNWSKKSELQEFSLVISKATYNKATTDVTKQRRWAMVASDTDADSCNDSMSLELFSDFINRANIGELPPEDYRSEFWFGGLPYHYPDLDGKAVPGVVEEIYIDGNRFKAKGYYNNTPLGIACFESVCNDLYNPERQKADDKVRVSIAFLDYKHRHKSNGAIFDHLTSQETGCSECFKELMAEILEGKKPQGKEFLRGHLIHLAHTRVPVNTRTSMEVDKSMTTRLEDAKSIVGELAEEIDENAKLIGKSDTLVIKSEEEKDVTNTSETLPEPNDVTTTELIEESITKKEQDCSHPSSHYLVVEDTSKPTTWHLRVKNCSGEYDHRLMGAAWAALHEGYRGNKYEGANKEEALSKLKGIYKREGLETPSKADFEDTFITFGDLIDLLDTRLPKTNGQAHPLDAVFDEFRSAYDEISKSELSVEEKMLQMQEHYNKFATFVRDSLVPKQEQKISSIDTLESSAMTKLVESIGIMCSKLDTVIAKMSAYNPQISPPTSTMPVRRSFTPQEIAQSYPASGIKGSTIDQIVSRTT